MAGIEIKGLQKAYPIDGGTLRVLRGIDLYLPEGAITVVLARVAAARPPCCGWSVDWRRRTAGKYTFRVRRKRPLSFRNRA